MSNETEPLSVAEYCAAFGVSPQSVYSRIRRGSLEAVEVDGVKRILNAGAPPIAVVAAPAVVQNAEVVQLLKGVVKDQRREIKRLHKAIKKLESQRFKDWDLLRDLVSSPGLKSSGAVLDVEVVPGKKKKGKRKR